MMENDDRLIQSFMQANKHEVADNGFSRHVIRRLPQRAEHWSNLLTLCCTVLCSLLFYAYDGFDLLFRAFTEFITTLSYELLSQQVNLPSLFLAAVVLLYIGVHRICSWKG